MDRPEVNRTWISFGSSLRGPHRTIKAPEGRSATFRVPGLGFFLVFFFCFVFVFVFDFSFFDRNCGSISLLLFFSKKKHVRVLPAYTGRSNTNGKRFESTHGGSSPVLLTRKAHVGSSRASEVHRKQPLNVAMFKFEKRSRTTCSRFLQSFALPDKAVKLQLLWRNVGGNQP